MQLLVSAKFYVSEKFNLLADPQINFTLASDVGNDFTKLNIGLGVGMRYDFTKKLFEQSRYTSQVNNYYTGIWNLSSRIGFLSAGLGYRF